MKELIEEIKRRVLIIQSEPQTMARELMIDNLCVGLENYKETLYTKEDLCEAFHAHNDTWIDYEEWFKQFKK